MAKTAVKSKKNPKPTKAKKRRRGMLDLPKAIEERLAEGRAERERVPLDAHAEWAAPAERPDPVGILESQNATRVPELVPIRHGRMIVSPFTFYRGGAAIMAGDLSRTPTSGLRVQCCGDAHLSNFGVFAAPDRRLVFDLNDFDETLPAPFEWDVKRLVASVVVAARDNGHRHKDQPPRRAPTAAVYRRTMAKARAMRFLEVWYTRIDAEKRARRLPERRQGHGQGREERPRQGAHANEPGLAVEVRRAQQRRVPDQGAATGHRAPARDDVPSDVEQIVRRAWPTTRAPSRPSGGSYSTTTTTWTSPARSSASARSGPRRSWSC